MQLAFLPGILWLSASHRLPFMESMAAHWLFLAIIFILCLPGGGFNYRYVEKPLVALGKRISARR